MSKVQKGDLPFLHSNFILFFKKGTAIGSAIKGVREKAMRPVMPVFVVHKS